MQAWTFNTRGLPAQVLKLRHDFPQPQPTELSSDQVIVKVSHVALFAPEASLMAVLPHFSDVLWIPGFSFSGTISALHNKTSTHTADKLEVGDSVFGMISPRRFRDYNGLLAEYAIVPRDCVSRKPRNISLSEAAGLSGAGGTVIGIAEKAGLLVIEPTAQGYRIESKAEGKQILVTGGSTGTGIFMLQLAKALVGKDGKIVTTSSPRNQQAVLALGPDEIIDYTKHPHLHRHLAERYSSTPFDVIIDITGSDPLLYPRSPAYLKPDGFFVFAGNMSTTHTPPATGVLGSLSWLYTTASLVAWWQWSSIRPLLLGGTPRKCFFHSGNPSAKLNELVSRLVEDGKLKIVVDSVWAMADVLKAYEHLARGKIRGQVMVNVQG